MKLRAGERNYKGHAIPSTAIVKTNKEGFEVYVSAVTENEIVFKRIIEGTFYSVKYNLKILELFK